MTDELKKKLVSEILDYNQRNKILSKVNTIWANVEGTVCYFRGEGFYRDMYKVDIDPENTRAYSDEWASEKEHVSVLSETDKYLMIYHVK
jgi:hypothetical protein